MKVDKYRVIGELIETNKRQFVIPVYQRNYDWKKENCKKLYDDIITSAKKQKFHFLGSIVYVDMGEQDKIYRYLIIDGQQRITTIFILMKALFDISEDNNTKEKINDILFNKDKYQELSLNEQTKIKLKPIKSDNEQLIHLFNNEFNEIEKKSQIYVNYVFLKSLVQSSINNGMTCNEILDGLKWLTSAVIVLKTEDGDDPQVVFESINSTGVPLSLADLIRNYVLMTDKNQDKLFENYWLKIEKNVGVDKMSAFIVDYLTIKTKDQVGSKNAYEIYRKFAEKTKMSNEDLLKDLLHYSELYKAFLYGDSKFGEIINKKLFGLRSIEQTTVFPFLFQVFDDYLNKVFSDITILEKIISFLLNYHLRRLICEVSSNSFKGLYKTLYNRIFSDEANKLKYYDAIVQFIGELTTKDAIPSDTEVKEALLSKDLYHKKNVCKYLLNLIEEINDDGKENKEIVWGGDKPITIEHIMPQKLTDEWKEELGEEFEITYTKYLHTLGNLTLTVYNSELGSKSFEEKKQILSDNNTHIVVLNEDIMKAPVWNANSICARANKLSSKLLQILAIKAPQVKVNFSSRNINKKSIFSGEDLIGTTPTSFILLGESVSINSYNGMLIAIANLLHGIDNSILNDLAENNYVIPFATKTYVSKEPDILRKPYEIGNSGIYIETNLSSKNVVSFIRALLDRFGLDDSDFVFFVKDQEESKNATTATSAIDNASDKARALYETLKNKALKKHPELYIQEKKLYTAFKISKNIFDVIFLKKGLKVYINLKRGELKDEKNFAEDCKEKGHWGNGDYYAIISTDEEIDYLLDLIAQSIEKNK